MFRTVLALSLLLPYASAHADVVQALAEAGYVEASAAELPGWNAHVDRDFLVSRDEDALCVHVGADTLHQFDRSPLQQGRFSYEGIDNGEWGGELVLVEPDGKRRTLLEENVQAMLPAPDGLLVFTGLAHMGSSRGAIHRVHAPDTAPRIEKITLLPDAPEVIVSDLRRNDFRRVLVLGSSSLMMLSEFGGDDDLDVLLIEQPWATLYPGSAVMFDDQLVFGMRGGLAVVRIAGFDAQTAPRYFTSPASASDVDAGTSPDQPACFPIR